MVTSRFFTTDRAAGDFGGADADVPAGPPGPWTTLRQVHGAEVVVVQGPGDGAGLRADAAVTDRPGCTLAVRTADCAPVVIRGERGVAVVHAGWRGLMEGVVAAAVGALTPLSPGPLRAWIGPCIRPGCYEFGPAELGIVAARWGDAVRSTTMWGVPALDLAAGVGLALAEAGVLTVEDEGWCTACVPARWFSHRARGDTGRMATVAWLE